MKVLQGSLKETQYNWPKCPVIEESQHAPLQVKGSTLLYQNDVTYISDKVSHAGYGDSLEAS